jgi:MFS family permease
MTTEPATTGRAQAAAWVTVGAAFTAMFTAFGVAYSFGAFFPSLLAEFDAGRGAVAAIFSVTTFAFFFLGAFSGVAVDRVGPRRVLLVGAAALGLGLLATAQARSLVVAGLTYGLGVGIGVACAYVPMVAVVSASFERRRTLAVGIAVSGIGLGTLVGAPLAARLIAAVGWRTTFVVFAAAGAAILALCAVVVTRPPIPTAARAGTLRATVASRTYVLIYGSGVLLSVALFVPFVHLPAYAELNGFGRVAGAGLVGLIGAASVVGRIGLGAIADRVGVVRTFQVCFLLVGASFALWWAAGGFRLLVAFALVLGVGYGGFVALGPAVVAELFGTDRLGGLLGVLYTAAAFGSLIGPPLAGVLTDASGTYRPAIAAAFVVGLASFALIAAVKQQSRGEDAP